MTLPIVQVVLQGLSSVAIAGGLIYTAIQFRAARRAQLVANFAKLVELQLQLRRMRVDDPSIASVHRHDIEDLSTDREIREYFLNLMQLGVFEIAWFSRKQGQIPEDYYQSWLARMRAISREPSFQAMMRKKSTKIFHDEFERLVEAMVRES